MIVDRIERAELYRGLGAGIAAALDYVRTTDFTRVEPGRVELDGDRLFAIVQRSPTRLPGEAVWESHRRYVDVQFVARGAERFAYCDLSDRPTVTQPYDEQRDLALYAPCGVEIPAPAGTFMVFFPDDVHAPSLADGTPAEVLKVVVKVARE